MTPYEEGRDAAEKGIHFNDCPYFFCRTGVSLEEFQAQYKAKLDGWFNGWKDWLDEHGLQYDFKPRGAGKRWTAARRAALQETSHG